MSLLDQAIEQKVRLAAGKKIAIQVFQDGLDAGLIKSVGKYLGTSAAGATVKEAFLFAASRAIHPAAGLIAGVQFDKADSLLRVIEGRGATASKGNLSRKLLKVMVVRWAVLAVSGSIYDGKTEGKTPEQIVNAVLRMCKKDLDSLFRAEEKGKK